MPIADRVQSNQSVEVRRGTRASLTTAASVKLFDASRAEGFGGLTRRLPTDISRFCAYTPAGNDGFEISYQASAGKQDMVRHSVQSILVAGALLSAHSILAAGIDGRVLDDVDAPVTGALITLVRPDGLYSETVYSDNEGRFHLDTALEGQLTLHARAPRFADAEQSVRLPAAGTATAAFKMRRLTSPDELSYGLTASAQFKRLNFKSESQRQDFQNDCLSCHQIGNERTRKAAPIEYWQATV